MPTYVIILKLKNYGWRMKLYDNLHYLNNSALSITFLIS